jgi:membrane protease YdiL (CAAX protease family)
VSIWEVFFLFSWLFTRYESSFGKIPAILLTALSVGLYHIGTLKSENIIYLVFCVFILAICFSITKNIFTLWPLYWTIGCSASTLRSGMEFSGLFIGVFVFILVVQIGYLLYLKKKCKN